VLHQDDQEIGLRVWLEIDLIDSVTGDDGIHPRVTVIHLELVGTEELLGIGMGRRGELSQGHFNNSGIGESGHHMQGTEAKPLE
jgi:hypothetical protein